MATNNTLVTEYLAGLPQPAQKICKALRSLAREAMPGAHEIVYHNALGYSLTQSPFDRICYVAPQKKGYVNFGFFFGEALPDTSGLLMGTGKRLRHVKVHSTEEAKNAHLRKLINAAWKNAESDIAGWRQSLRKKV